MSDHQPEPLPRAPLAYENSEFLDSQDGRIFRILSEYQEPLTRFPPRTHRRHRRLLRVGPLPPAR